MLRQGLRLRLLQLALQRRSQNLGLTVLPKLALDIAMHGGDAMRTTIHDMVDLPGAAWPWDADQTGFFKQRRQASWDAQPRQSLRQMQLTTKLLARRRTKPQANSAPLLGQLRDPGFEPAMHEVEQESRERRPQRYPAPTDLNLGQSRNLIEKFTRDAAITDGTKSMERPALDRT